MEEKKQKWSNIQQKVQELIANVSQFIGEVEAIHGDMNLTRREEKEKVYQLEMNSSKNFDCLWQRVFVEQA